MRIEYEALTQNDVVVHTAASRISRVQGFFNGSTANRWLQLHDAKATPADTAVPLRVWPIYMGAPFDQNFQNDPIATVNGVVFVVSSTQATLTISADTMDIYVTGTSSWDNTGVSTAGDYTTGVEKLGVFTNAINKALLRLEFTALTSFGAPLYAKLFGAGVTTPAAGDIPVVTMLLPDNTSKDFFFNTWPNFTDEGENPYHGCSVKIDETPGVLVGTYAGTDFAIKATYK